jgi:glycosyltransferase involved in cell wall biosynthesis
MPINRPGGPVSVLTVTKRTETLARCIATVEAQTHDGPIEHVFIIDDNRQARALLDAHTPSRVSRQVHRIPRAAHDQDGPARLAHLRNHAVDAARHELIAFLDDDNTWEPEHLATLIHASNTGEALSHSERRMFYADGRPYDAPEFPWKRDVASRRALYDQYVALGAVTPGDNIFRDNIGLPDTCVDLGEWLLPRSFVQQFRFDEQYDVSNWQNIVVEDWGLAREILASGKTVVSTHQPTLHYYLGGYSNNFSSSASIYWKEPA